MKTICGSLLALTGVAALPAAAQYAPTADSTMQIYGRTDASVNFQRRSGNASTWSAVGSDTSFIGFRGTEDLGGGLRAYFKLEHGFDVSTGNPGSASFFNREAFVGLSSNTFGSIQLGTAWTPEIWLSGRLDPFNRSQLGASQTLFQGTTSRGYGVQFLNAVQYISPPVADFQARLYVAAAEGTPAKGHGVALDYFGGELYAGLAYDEIGVAGSAVGLPKQAVATSRTLALGASYKFSIVKISVYAQQNRTESLPQVSGGAVGATIPIGAGEIRASYSVYGAGKRRASLAAVGYLHYLSRRTSLYGSYGVLLNGPSTAFTLAPTGPDFASGPMKADQNARGLGFGIRHLF